MSKISDIFDALKTVMATQLSGYQQIPDPFLADEAASPILARGYSIAMGPGQPHSRSDVTCTKKISRGIQIQLVRRIENTQNEITAYETTVKAMFEDQFTLLKHLETEGQLGGKAINTDYVGDNGLVEFPTKDNLGRHLDLTTTFQVSYQENLNL